MADLGELTSYVKESLERIGNKIYSRQAGYFICVFEELGIDNAKLATTSMVDNIATCFMERCSLSRSHKVVKESHTQNMLERIVIDSAKFAMTPMVDSIATCLMERFPVRPGNRIVEDSHTETW